MDGPNFANRRCCELDMREFGTNKPWMYVDFCNTTTAGFTGDSVFAMKMGVKTIKFDNPMDGTMSITFQVHPFRVYALLSDGVIETTAVIPGKEDVTATDAGELTILETPIPGSVFVYAQGDFGGDEIEGSFAAGVFTATTPADIVIDITYTVAYLVEKTTGVKKVSFNDNKIPKAFRITQETLYKDENETLIPVKMIAYKASPQRNMEWSWASDGDPASLTITFDVLGDPDGNFLEMVEIA